MARPLCPIGKRLPAGTEAWAGQPSPPRSTQAVSQFQAAWSARSAPGPGSAPARGNASGSLAGEHPARWACRSVEYMVTSLVRAIGDNTVARAAGDRLRGDVLLPQQRSAR